MTQTQTPKKSKTRTTRQTATSRIIVGMLTEHVGHHMLDSGDYYGRNYEANQGRQFEQETPVSLSFKHGYIDCTLNLYHWLNSRLTYCPEMQRRFTRFASKPDQESVSWFETVSNFIHYLQGKDIDVQSESPVNTYNHESLLSQVILWQSVQIDGDAYIVLQVHGGCDVRGGYTAPKWFKENEYQAMFEDSRATIYCTGNSEHYWDTDDAYHWYEEGSCGFGAGQQLQEYPRIEEDAADLEEQEPELKAIREAIHRGTQQLATMQVLQPQNAARLQAQHTAAVEKLTAEAEEILAKYRGNGSLFIDSEGAGYCPHCGSKLEASTY